MAARPLGTSANFRPMDGERYPAHTATPRHENVGPDIPCNPIEAKIKTTLSDESAMLEGSLGRAALINVHHVIHGKKQQARDEHA